jgi:DNA topoisomerase-3
LQDKNFFPPRNGGKDDKSHPPIYPAKLLSETHEERFEDDDYLLYDLIVRHFLASCSKDAKADEHILNYLISDEEFFISFIEIKEKNYLDIYPYDVWLKKNNIAYESYFKQVNYLKI